MKKTLILCTLLCAASALNGMNNRYAGLEELAPEVKVIILQAFNAYDNPTDVIKAIKAISATNRQLRDIVQDEYGNQKRFKALVHALANKFNVSTKSVAEQLGTPLTAKNYTLAGDTLTQAITDGNVNGVVQAIKLGADVNYSFDHAEEKLTPLLLAVNHEKDDIVQLLLENGANPNFIGGHDMLTGRGLKAIDYLYMKKGDAQQKEKIKALLEKAMKKQK
jgi:ankyrin repeat protein